MESLGGPLYTVAGAGESHGPAVSTIICGCPAGYYLRRSDVQPFLDRRRPGGNKHGTPRNEKDKVVFLSGLYQSDHAKLLGGSEVTIRVDDAEFHTEGYEEGFTTGEPIAAIVLSTSKKSGDYTQFTGPTGEARPGHTDLLKHHKSRGFVDVRGGGRSSYRSTISDVIGGSIARLFLQKTFGTVFLSSICQVGELKSKQSLAEHVNQIIIQAKNVSIDETQIASIQSSLRQSEIPSIDQGFATEAAELIKKTRMKGDSLGAAVEVIGINVPPLLGDPLYQSLKTRIMGTLGGLNAAQSCEVGSGHEVVSRHGSQNNDPIRGYGFESNTHGGLLGGMTSGMPLVFRVGFKPTATIHQSQRSVRKNLEEIDFQLDKGRHDPCVGVRAGVTLESRMAIEIMNSALAHQAQQLNGDFPQVF